MTSANDKNSEHLRAGIQPHAEAVYIHSMLFNTRSAKVSIDSVAKMLKSISQGTAGESGGVAEMDFVLNGLQNVVAQGAALSRYFWPARQKHQKRGEQLRSACSVDTSSALYSRRLRNSIEHFDERLDEYFCGDHIAGSILPHYIGLEENCSELADKVFRSYFVDTGVFSVLDEAIEVPPIAAEIIRIHRLLESFTACGWRLPSRDQSNIT